MHFIVVVKCGIGNHTAFPMLTGGSHYRGMVQCHMNMDYVVYNIRIPND